MYSLIKLLHLSAAILWLGGMSFMLLAMRPALLAQLEGAQRLPVLVAVWTRFFALVATCVLILLLSGTYFFASVPKGAHANIALGWHLMFGIGTLMMLIFGHMYFAVFKACKKALIAGDSATAAAKAAQIHRLVQINFTLGWLAVAAVKLL